MKTDGFTFKPVGFKRSAVQLKSVAKSRVVAPPRTKQVPDRCMRYEDAVSLAKDISDLEGRYFAIINGSFIFGDFIEALFVENDLHAKTLTISTLSLNENNVDSLRNLIDGGYVDELNLIVSDYFYSHERSLLVPYIYEQLDIDDKFQLAVAGTHCKVAFFETHCGLKVALHGSANLRSSNNIEQFVYEHNETIYDFLKSTHDAIFATFSTINKPVRNSQLWQAVAQKGEAGQKRNPAKEKSQKQKSATQGV